MMHHSKREAVYLRLRDALERNCYCRGEKLPPEVILSRQLGVARVTLRAALSELEAEGYVERCHPGGTKVTGSVRQQLLVVLPDHFDALNPAYYLYPGIQQGCRKWSLALTALSRSELPEILDDAGRYLGALLLCGGYRGDERELQTLRRAPFPTVQLFGTEADIAVTGFAAVLPDYRAGYLAALSHLIEFGHRRIAFLYRNPEHNGLTVDEVKRFFAARQAAESIGLLREYRDFSEIRNIVRELTALPEAPSAICCYSDHVALEVYAELKELKLAIPRQVAVMNCFGAPGAVALKPELSFIDAFHRLAAETALDLLIHQGSWNSGKPVIHTPFGVVVNESTRQIRYEIIHHPTGEKI